MSRPVPELEFDRPIVRESIAEMVAHRVLEMVKAGALKPGDQLPPERDLAASLNVSRPSVREAIRGLSILGVVRTRQGGGAYISKLDADALLGPLQFFISLEQVNIDELYDARSLVESNVARRAAELRPSESRCSPLRTWAAHDTPASLGCGTSSSSSGRRRAGPSWSRKAGRAASPCCSSSRSTIIGAAPTPSGWPPR